MNKTFAKLSMLLVFLVGTVFGQTTVSIPDTSLVKDTEIILTIGSDSISKVGSLTLNIEYDSDVLEFDAETGVLNSPFAGLSVVDKDSLITIGWFSVTPVAVTDKLMDLKFQYKGGTSDLKFTGNNEITDELAQVLTTAFVDGKVDPLPPTMSLGKVYPIKGETVLVPFTGANLVDLGSMTLYIEYDTASASFNEIKNDIVGFTYNDDGAGKITLGWFDVDGFTLGDGILANLEFLFKEGATDLVFGASSEITDIANDPVTILFNNGRIAEKNGGFSLPNLRKGQGDVTFDFSGTALDEIGSFTIDFAVDKDVITLKSYNSVVAGNFSANQTEGTVTIAYFNTDGLTLGNGKIADLVFEYVGGSSDLTFDNLNAEITEVGGNLITDVVFTDGSIIENILPVLTDIDTQTVAENDLLSFNLKVTDADDDTFVFESSNLPDGALLTDSVFTWTPSYEQAGEYTINFIVADLVGSTDSLDVVVIVTNTNRLPVFDAPLADQEVSIENILGTFQEFSYQYEASDSDGDSLSYALIEGPTGSALTESGLFTWTPADANANSSFLVIVSVTDGLAIVADSATLTTTNVVGVDYNDGLPTEFAIEQNYPNPFNPTTLIRFAIPQESNVVLRVYNLLGQEVTTLVNQVLPVGFHEFEFNASQFTSGVYIYRIEAGNFVSIKKMMLLK